MPTDALEKMPSINVISAIPTLCHLSTCNQSIPVMLIKRPIPPPEVAPNALAQKSNDPYAIIQQISTSITSSIGIFGRADLIPPAQADVLVPDPKYLSNPDYAQYAKWIKDSRFYIVALEAGRFLTDEVKFNFLDALCDALAGIIKKLGVSCEHVGRTHDLEHEALESFERGLVHHICLRLHSL